MPINLVGCKHGYSLYVCQHVYAYNTVGQVSIIWEDWQLNPGLQEWQQGQ